MRRKTTILLVMTAAAVALAVAAWPSVSFFMLTGSFFPIKKVDTLQHPIAVTRWDANGLNLADGRTVALPGLRLLPSTSPALAEVTKRGVDVGADGQVWGLVRIHHWCGNDAVREHVARVDLSQMMTFLRVGEPTSGVPEPELLVNESGGKFSEYGWDIGEFLGFQSWQSIAASAGRNDWGESQ
jgi:hypothetical protein